MAQKNVWSSTMVLTNVTTFGVAVGTTVLAVEVEVEDQYQLHIKLQNQSTRSLLSGPYNLSS